MKRKWRIGRAVLAGVLITRATVLLWQWQLGPQWSIPTTNVLGFDERRGLLLTSSYCNPMPRPPGHSPVGPLHAPSKDDARGVVVVARDLVRGDIRSQITLPS